MNASSSQFSRLLPRRLGLLCAALLSLMAQPSLAAPAIAHWLTDSGARVFFVENHSLPMLDVQIDFAAGTAYDSPNKAGVAALTRSLLELGSAGLDEQQLGEQLADLGAQLAGGVDMDRATLALRTLSMPDKRQPALALLHKVLSRPRFAEPIFAREQARSLASLKEALTRPETIAGQAFWRALYGTHPYAQQATPDSLSQLNRADLLAFYQQHYRARAATVSIVGDLQRAEAELLAQQLTADLPPGAAPSPLPSSIPEQSSSSDQASDQTHELRIAHPAAQAHLLIGLPAIARGDADFFPLLVGNYILGGGGFSSRLMQEVRDKRGFAYSVYSYFHPLAAPGPFQIGLQTKKSQANDALQLTRQVLADFLREGPSKSELKAAQQYLTGSFPLRLDSNRKILENVAVIGFYQLPLDYLERYTGQIEQVTGADIRAAFARHVQPEKLITVVVGAEAKE
ncbi:MAG: pitrilysin family protein [Pseudomonadota bacterium]